MFAIKDIESLKNLAAILTIPLFSAAYLMEGPFEIFRDPAIDWLRNSPHPWLKISGWAIWLIFLVAVVAIIFLLIDQAIIWLHIQTGGRYIMPWLGFSCLTIGILGLSYAFPKMPTSPINPFWHLGFLAYGLSLMDQASKR